MANDLTTIDVARRVDDGPGRGVGARWRGFVLLALLLTAAGCGGGGGGGGEDGASQATGTSVPADLIGQWRTILTYVPGFYTGIVPNSDTISSLGITLKFPPGGGYGFELSTATTYFGGNCFRTTDWNEIGVVSIAGSEITFRSTHAINSILDSCGKAQYIDPAPTSSATYTMTREQDATGWPMLRLRLPNGEEIVLERCRNCG